MSHENRISYCDHIHRKTGGCVCKNHPDKLPKCESILNLPEDIQTSVIVIDDQSRDTASLLRAKVQAQMRMRRHDLEIETRQDCEIPMTIIVDELPRPTESVWHKLINRKKPI